jgi:hypothetical protein
VWVAAARCNDLFNEIEQTSAVSMTEILEELPRLGRVEREKVRQGLEEIESGTVKETTYP